MSMSRLTTMMGIYATAASHWGNPMEMVNDAFGSNSPKWQMKRHEINRARKADKARKAARKARRRNRK